LTDAARDIAKQDSRTSMHGRRSPARCVGFNCFFESELAE
jgi:hypothetical protein